jgi:two-component system response regulator (stage 0 sporulation protein F)
MAIKLLVVDDELDVKELFLQRFRREIKAGKFSFVFAHSGEDALQLLAQVNPMDILLILSDINMPGMTGFDLLKQVKERLPHLKVFMVSAYGDAANMSRAIETGADGFIEKPVDFQLLEEKIAEAIEHA